MRVVLGVRGRFPTPEEAAAYEYSPHERALLESRASSQIVGAPETVRNGLAALMNETGANELIITTAVHSHTDRVRSFELIAEAVAMSSAEAD